MTSRIRVAVVGAGPAGMYAAGHLLEPPGGTYLNGRLQELVDIDVEVDVFDRLATQWGLVRHGVAPDHGEKKLVRRVFAETSARPGFRFFGNVEVGRDVTHAELREWYDAVIYAHGAADDRVLDIPGANLPGVISARSLVGWYNGHPDERHLDPDLGHGRAVVIGNGNVALDVARMLVQPANAISTTDVAPHALTALRQSKIREVVVMGRRGPGEAAFNNPELEGLGHLPGVSVRVTPDGILDKIAAPVDDLAATRKVGTLRDFAAGPTPHDRTLSLQFYSSPLRVLGTARAEGLEFEDTLDGLQGGVIEAGLVVSSVGFFGRRLSGLPWDPTTGSVPHNNGRVLDGDRELPGVYVTGWAKRGPRGIIGTNKKCARDTVLSLLADARAGVLSLGPALSAEAVERQVRARVTDVVDQAGWSRIDDLEFRRGRAQGRASDKIADGGQLLAVARGDVT